MKLILKQDNTAETPEITIKYRIMDCHLEHIVSQINGRGKIIIGINMERKVEKMLAVSDIYYIETVDKRAFINMKEDVYESKEKFNSLREELDSFNFCQISRTCILNTKKLEKVEVLANSRLKGFLNNGENIIISRKYINSLRDRLKGR